MEDRQILLLQKYAFIASFPFIYFKGVFFMVSHFLMMAQGKAVLMVLLPPQVKKS